eukprot:2915199-Rhodomonas_salina.1
MPDGIVRVVVWHPPREPHSLLLHSDVRLLTESWGVRVRGGKIALLGGVTACVDVAHALLSPIFLRELEGRSCSACHGLLEQETQKWGDWGLTEKVIFEKGCLQYC